MPVTPKSKRLPGKITPRSAIKVDYGERGFRGSPRYYVIDWKLSLGRRRTRPTVSMGRLHGMRTLASARKKATEIAKMLREHEYKATTQRWDGRDVYGYLNMMPASAFTDAQASALGNARKGYRSMIEKARPRRRKTTALLPTRRRTSRVKTRTAKRRTSKRRSSRRRTSRVKTRPAKRLKTRRAPTRKRRTTRRARR